MKVIGPCMVWNGHRNVHNYGQKRIKGRMWLLHRYAWQWANGPIPEGMCVCHACDNPPCVNPDHLWLGTQLENIRDRERKGRNGHANKTHCPQGHPYSGDNLIITTNNGRGCRECMRQHARRYARKNRKRMGRQDHQFKMANNTSGVNGVSRCQGKWQARITVNKKCHYLGIYDDWFDAVCARKSAEYIYGQECEDRDRHQGENRG